MNIEHYKDRLKLLNTLKKLRYKTFKNISAMTYFSTVFFVGVAVFAAMAMPGLSANHIFTGALLILNSYIIGIQHCQAMATWKLYRNSRDEYDLLKDVLAEKENERMGSSLEL